jgi:hypothetical protein
VRARDNFFDFQFIRNVKNRWPALHPLSFPVKETATGRLRPRRVRLIPSSHPLTLRSTTGSWRITANRQSLEHSVRGATHRPLNSDPHRKLAPEVVPKSSSGDLPEASLWTTSGLPHTSASCAPERQQRPGWRLLMARGLGFD